MHRSYANMLSRVIASSRSALARASAAPAAPSAVRFCTPRSPMALASFSSDAAPEDAMTASLTQGLGATHVEVEDISGGCGSMYRILVVSDKFDGVRPVQQHRMVHDVLKAEIGDMHGLTVTTKTPAQHGQ